MFYALETWQSTYIVNEKWYSERKQDTAAKIIRAEIREKTYDSKSYPTNEDIAKQYVSYVRAKYGNCCIVFDGYQEGPSIKDHENQRRVKKACAHIQFSESMKAHVNQETFLSNEGNKSQFILLLSHYLESDGHTVHNSTGDADTMIVACALHNYSKGRDRGQCGS